MVTGNFRRKYIRVKIVLLVKRDHYVPNRNIVPLTWKTGENYLYKCETDYKPKRGVRSTSRGSGPQSRYLGHLKYNLGYRHFFLRSLKKVKGEFRLMCIGWNLKKMHKMMAFG